MKSHIDEIIEALDKSFNNTPESVSINSTNKKVTYTLLNFL